MEANLNQFRLLTVEGEQVANAQRRGSHGEITADISGSLVKHRLVYDECPYFDSTKDRLLKIQLTRSTEHLPTSSLHQHNSRDHHHHHHQQQQQQHRHDDQLIDLYEPAICDHPHHHHHHQHRRRSHRQFCRHDAAFQWKPGAQSTRGHVTPAEVDDGDDDDCPSPRISDDDDDDDDDDVYETIDQNETSAPLTGMTRTGRASSGLENDSSELPAGVRYCRGDKNGAGEQNLINTMKSLERTVALHCQLLSRRLAREIRAPVQRKISSEVRQRPSQSSYVSSIPATNLRSDKVVVSMRVIFLKIGEIDTMKENFMADAFIQARWREPSLDSLQDKFKAVQSMEEIDWQKYWNPKLYVENNLGEPKETIWQTLSYGPRGEATVYERRRIKGCFLENLELDDFPFDTQELTLTITSERADTELELNEDTVEISSINVQSFVDEQEWALHSHVETWKCITTKIFQNSKLKHPSFSTSCRASRRAGFYIWNIFLVMLFICSLTFATFSVELTKPENRLQLSFILLLTTITFKFVVSQTLPRISYLTYLDKYILTSMAILCGVCVWHAVVPLFKHDLELAKMADKWGLIVFSSAYFLFHVFFFLYIYIMALKRRWKYDQKDREHKERVRKLQMLEEQNRLEAEKENRREDGQSNDVQDDIGKSPVEETKLDFIIVEGGHQGNNNSKAEITKARLDDSDSSVRHIGNFRAEDV